MHIQLRQSVFLLRNILKIYGICTTFHSKTSKKRKPKQMAPKQEAYSYVTEPGTDISLVLIMMFWPKASSIRTDWTQLAF